MNCSLTSVELSDFKSFDHVEVDLSEGAAGRRMAVVFGDNGSGKTHLVESMAALKMTVDTLTVRGLPQPAPGRLPRYAGEMELGDDGPGFFEVAHPGLGDPGGWDLPTLLSGFRPLSGGWPSFRVTFTIDGRKGEYRLQTDEDGRAVRESLTFVISKNVGEVFSIRRDGDRTVRSFSGSLFKSQRFGDDVERTVIDEWGDHTFLAIVKRAMLESGDRIDGLMGTGIADVIRMIDGMVVVCDRGFPFLDDGLRGFMAGDAERDVIRVEGLDRLERQRAALELYMRGACADVRGVRYDVSIDGGAASYEMVLEREVCGRVVDVPSVLESAGTRGIIRMFPALIACRRGAVALIDGFDAGVHETVIRGIASESAASERGQLIATAHCTGLMEDLDPRAVYVIQSDPGASRCILPLPRIERTMREHNNRNRYLHGTFGGTPRTGDIDMGRISEVMDEK